jgi:DNA-binding NarL/FixJ family response regulator
LVTDVVMPDVGGRALAEALRHSRPGLKVLFMSGYTNDALVRQGIEASRVAFIHKPFTPRALAEKIREVLESSGPSALAEP